MWYNIHYTMPEWKCTLCGKDFCSKQRLTYHNDNHVCIKRQHICDKCGQNFTRKAPLQYHVEHEVCQKQTQLVLKKKQVKSPECDGESDFIRLKEENIQLKAKIQVLEDHPQNQTINITNNIIVPPAFLKVDTYQQLMQNMPRLLHTALSEHTNSCVSYLIKETTCNPQLPIYNSIKMTNHRDPYLHVSDGEKFVYATKKKTINELIENKRSLMQKYFDDNRDNYGKRVLERYERYVDHLDDDEGQKELEHEVICMLLNMSDVIGSDEWSRKLLGDLKVWNPVNVIES